MSSTEMDTRLYRIQMVFVLAWMLCFCPAILWSKKESVCWIWALALELFPFFWRQRQKGNILLG